MIVVVRETSTEFNWRVAGLCMFKNYDEKTKDMGMILYWQVVIKGILRDNSVKIRYKGALAKLGNFYVDKFGICRLDAVDKIELVDGDHSEKPNIWRRKLMMKKIVL